MYVLKKKIGPNHLSAIIGIYFTEWTSYILSIFVYDTRNFVSVIFYLTRITRLPWKMINILGEKQRVYNTRTSLILTEHFQ